MLPSLATLRTDIVLFDNVDQLRWRDPTPAFATLGARLDAAVAEKKYVFRAGVPANVKISETSSILEG